MPSSTDRIVKEVQLNAPLERVWRAISDSQQFGAWFGVKFDAPFKPGAKMFGAITPTTVDAQIAKSQEPYAGQRFEVVVEKLEPMRLFSFRWHPFGVDKAADYSHESATLVEFALEGDARQTRLVITESGFDQLPLERRAKAFQANDGGWSAQCNLLKRYVEA